MGGPRAALLSLRGKTSGQAWEYIPSGSTSVVQKCDSAGLERTNPAHSISLEWVPRDNIWDLGIGYLTEGSLFSCGLEPHRMVYTHGVIYDGDLGPCAISLTSGSPGGWETKVSHESAPCLCGWPPIKPWTVRLPWLMMLSMCSRTLFLGELSDIPNGFHWESTPRSLCLVDPRIHLKWLFPLSTLICISSL